MFCFFFALCGGCPHQFSRSIHPLLVLLNTPPRSIHTALVLHLKTQKNRSKLSKAAPLLATPLPLYLFPSSSTVHLLHLFLLNSIPETFCPLSFSAKPALQYRPVIPSYLLFLSFFSPIAITSLLP